MKERVYSRDMLSLFIIWIIYNDNYGSITSDSVYPIALNFKLEFTDTNF